jgi:hypothetical protein
LASKIAGNYMDKIEKGRKEDPDKRFYEMVPLVLC